MTIRAAIPGLENALNDLRKNTIEKVETKADKKRG